MLQLTVRLVVSLVIVVGILLLLTKIGSRRFTGRGGALIHVVHRQPLSRTSSLAVVTVGGRVLVLGATEHQVNVLAELDPDELALAEIVDATAQADSERAELSELDELTELHHLVDDVSLDVRPAALPHRPSGRHAAGRIAGRPSAPVGRLSGSVLSVDTWRQAFAAATGRPS